MLETRIRAKADLDKGIKETFLNTLFVTEDSAAHQFEIQVERSGTALQLEDASAKGYFIRFNSTDENETIIIDDQEHVNISGNVVSVKLKSACYTQPRQFAIVIKLMADGEESTVFYGVGSMRINRADVIVDDAKRIPSLNDILAMIDEMEQATKEAENAVEIAGAWANATTSVTTLSPDSPATVAVKDVGGVRTIAFGIPQGIQGEQGIQGIQGPKGSTGDSGVAVSETEPTDPNIDVWIKPDGVTDDNGYVVDTDKFANAIMDESARAASHEIYAQDGNISVTMYGKTMQEGSGDPSHDNVRPISGVDAVRVHVGGKNLYTPAIRQAVNCTAEVNGGDVTAVSARGGVISIVKFEPIHVVPGMQYTFSAIYSKTPTAGYLFITDKDKQDTSQYGKVDAETRSVTFTASSESLYLFAYLGYTSTPEVQTLMLKDMQLEIGSAATDYEPHSANVVDMTDVLNGEPLYGNGTVDDTIESCVKVNGERKCRITRRYNMVYVRDLPINSLSNTPGILFFQGLTGIRAPEATNISYCNKYKLVPGGWAGFQNVNNSFNVLGGQIGIRDDNAIGTLDEVRAYFAASDAYIIYPLETPKVFYADPVELSKPAGLMPATITGSGETDVQYMHDTKHYIDQKFEALHAALMGG